MVVVPCREGPEGQGESAGERDNGCGRLQLSGHRGKFHRPRSKVRYLDLFLPLPGPLKGALKICDDGGGHS